MSSPWEQQSWLLLAPSQTPPLARSCHWAITLCKLTLPCPSQLFSHSPKQYLKCLFLFLVQDWKASFLCFFFPLRNLLETWGISLTPYYQLDMSSSSASLGLCLVTQQVPKKKQDITPERRCHQMEAYYSLNLPPYHSSSGPPTNSCFHGISPASVIISHVCSAVL